MSGYGIMGWLLRGKGAYNGISGDMTSKIVNYPVLLVFCLRNSIMIKVSYLD